MGLDTKVFAVGQKRRTQNGRRGRSAALIRPLHPLDYLMPCGKRQRARRIVYRRRKASRLRRCERRSRGKCATFLKIKKCHYELQADVELITTRTHTLQSTGATLYARAKELIHFSPLSCTHLTSRGWERKGCAMYAYPICDNSFRTILRTIIMSLWTCVCARARASYSEKGKFFLVCKICCFSSILFSLLFFSFSGNYKIAGRGRIACVVQRNW